jgi:hypothetical protein
MYPLKSDPSSNLYAYCQEAIDTYYKKTPKPALQNYTNFEEVLYHLNLLAPYFSDTNYLNGSSALIMPRTLPDVLEFGRKSKAVDRNVLRCLTNNLIDTLVDHFIDACALATVQKSTQIAKLGCFLAQLEKEFDIGIITLNYDNIFTQACPSLFTGFDPVTGTFDPLSVLQRDEWGFIYHLHGSIHFAMTGTQQDMHEITWTATPAKEQNAHAYGRNAQDSREGITYPTSIIVAGYSKTQQILRQPFRTYFAQLNRLVHEADSLLFIGYGFGDLHLNSAFSEVRDIRRPVVIVGYANDDEESLPFRSDAWANQLFKTLLTNASEMSQPGHSSPASISKLKAANEVETSNNPMYPLAVWYNGLIEACQHSTKIMSHL